MSDVDSGWPSAADVHAGMDAVDSGGDTSSSSETAPPPAETAPPATAAAPAATPPASTGDEDVFAELAEGEQQFSRGYVEKLRREGLRHRTEAQAAKELFAGYEEGDTQLWKEMIRGWAQGDVQGVAQTMRTIANSTLGDGDVTTPITPEPTSSTPPPPPPPPTPTTGQEPAKALTEDDIDRIVEQRLAERERVAQENAAVRGVYDEIKAAGIVEDSDDWFLALRYASRTVEQGGTGGNVADAIAKVKGRDQAVIDRYVESKRSGAGGPTVAPQQGVVASGVETQQDFPNRRDVQAFLESSSRAQAGQ